MKHEIVEKLKEEFGDRLICVGLHNVGVTSFLNKNGLFVVLDELDSTDLFAVKKVYTKYKKLYSTPIVVKKDFFDRSSKIFCMEILELKENSEIIYGENVLKNIEVLDEDLKKQIKYEVMSKSLVLKGAFIDLPLDRKVVDSITYRSLYNFLLIMRNVLRLKGKLINDPTLIEAFEEMFDVSLESFKILRDTEKMPFDKLLKVFKKYVEEVDSVVEVVYRNFS